MCVLCVCVCVCVCACLCVCVLVCVCVCVCVSEHVFSTSHLCPSPRPSFLCENC